MVELNEKELKDKLNKIEEIRREIAKIIERFLNNITEELFASKAAADRIVYSIFNNTFLLGTQLCSCYYELHRED